ncbi:MAG TPA: oligosaccharide flippase family protein [Clostridia bacterium]|nr:oligosaccharide flippase family protein [Clostridia bacterium]
MKEALEETFSDEIDLSLVKKRSLVGVVSLVSRSFLIQGIAFGSTFLLTVFLDPQTFGVFYLVSAFINFFAYFSDVGLAAALIQKKEKVTDEDLRTTFGVQQFLVLALLIFIFILSPFAQEWYGLSQAGIYLLYALGFSFFLSSLKTIPSIILERSLKFNLLIIPQILETVTFNLVAVILAWRGFGLTSFTWAVLARGIVGLVSMYLIAPWRVGFAFSRPSLSRLLKFGVPYQANTLMAVAKDDLMTIFLGRIIGASGLGYLGWAKRWAEQPLRFLMDNVSKVAFPAYSRMQDRKESLKRAVEKTLFFLSFLTFPILMGFSLLASDLVEVIPRYLKWEPALLALYLYSFNSAWATISTSMTNLLNAVGQIKKTFKLMIMWLGLTWALMPVLAIRLGFNGVAIAAATISLSSAIAIYIARKVVKFDLGSSIGKPLLATLFMGIFVFLFKPMTENLILSLGLRILAGGFVYLLVSYLLIGKALFEDSFRLYSLLRKKQ